MSKKIFYIGNAKRKDVETDIKKYGISLLGAYSLSNGTWYALVHRIADRSYSKLIGGTLAEGFERLTKRTRARNKLEDAIKIQQKLLIQTPFDSDLLDSLTELMTQQKYPERAISEDVSIKELVSELNDTVMHELGLHWAGDLKHMIYSIDFKNGIPVNTLLSIIKKYKIKTLPGITGERNLIKTNDLILARRAEFLKPIEQKEQIYEMCKVLDYIGINYRDNQNSYDYPVEFEMDDIKIRKELPKNSDKPKKPAIL